jgi:FlgD Ig-like domain
MYAVKASESAQTGGTHIGNRYANTASMGLLDGKQASIGPRKSWLRTYYNWVSWLTGDLNTQMVGPFTNVGEDDIGLIEDFLSTPGGTPQPRALFVQGQGFAQDADAEGGTHLTFLNNYLFAGYRTDSYTKLTPGLVGCPDLTVTSDITTNGDVYAVSNSCTTTNNVLSVGTVESIPVSDYQNVGVNGPYHAAIMHNHSSTYNWTTVIDAWDIFNTYGRYCATSMGRLAYYHNLMTHTFGTYCSVWGVPATTLDVPQNGHAGQFVNFMKVDNSVMRSGASAQIEFGVETTGRVAVNLYDVTGRHVRTLADRTFQASASNRLTWNGTDDSGNQVPRGVYFARIQYAGKTALNGRVVVLR